MYKIYDKNAVLVLQTNSVIEAGHTLLSTNGYTYEIHKGRDNLFSYVLWLQNYLFKGAPYPTKIDSFEADPDKATIDIMRKVLNNREWYPDLLLQEI